MFVEGHDDITGDGCALSQMGHKSILFYRDGVAAHLSLSNSYARYRITIRMDMFWEAFCCSSAGNALTARVSVPIVGAS